MTCSSSESGTKANESPVLVLRFRDLGIEPGETIYRHRRVIATYDRCWWGWWARKHEANPSWLSKMDWPATVYLYDRDALS